MKFCQFHKSTAHATSECDRNFSSSPREVIALLKNVENIRVIEEKPLRKELRWRTKHPDAYRDYQRQYMAGKREKARLAGKVSAHA